MTAATIKLFAVTFEVVAVVAATSEAEAIKYADAHSRMIISSESEAQCDAREIKAEADLPEGWESDCNPYGANVADLTIGDYLDMMPPPVIRDDKTIDMFAEPEPRVIAIDTREHIAPEPIMQRPHP